MRHLFLLLSCLVYGAVMNSQGNSRANKDYALFFAVEDYEHMGKLSNPIDNATAIAEELRTDYGFQTEVVKDPTFAQVAAKIAEYQRKFASGSYDQKGQLLIFFTGHGVQRGNNGYFLPKDGNPTVLYEKVIEYDNWRYEIDQIECQHILVTIDACYSLAFDPNWRNKTDRDFGRRGDATKDQVLLDHQTYRSRLFFTSDATNNQTPDRSTFARQLLTGLRTHRGANGYLSADELFAIYLKRAAPVPGGGDFGRDEPRSRFLFFRQQQDLPIDARADLSAWTAAKTGNNCAGYRDYLNKFPTGEFTAEARQRVTACEATETMLADWLTAKESNTVEAYIAFVTKHPDSPYVETAGLALQTLAKSYVLDNMVAIPGGTFQMGDQFGFINFEEKPVHTVNLADFYLSKTELTNREFTAFLNAIGDRQIDGSKLYKVSGGKKGISKGDEGFSPKPGQDDYPVVNVSWYGAVAYCNWLSTVLGYTPVYEIDGTELSLNLSANGYRLPTEAEWEFAARSGGKGEKWAGTSTKKELAQFANYTGSKDGYYAIAPVGMFQANSLGLRDMAGNVSEWCWDLYAEDSYGESRENNPVGPDSGFERVIRGGSWESDPDECRASSRNKRSPANRGGSVGFRIARSPGNGEEFRPE